MSGNEFLKHPPHKNTGVPPARYNLMRLQMEAAKLPFMRRVFDDGILDVKKIYGDSYKAEWTPLGEADICYLVRYVDSDSEIKVILLNKKLEKVTEVDASVLPSLEFDLTSRELKLYGDLICVVTLSAADNKQIRLRFYSTVTGTFLTDKVDLIQFSPSFTLLSIHFSAVFYAGVGTGIPTLCLYQEGDILYASVGSTLKKIQISKDENGAYVFTTTTFYFAAMGSYANPYYDYVRYLYCENGEFFYGWDSDVTAFLGRVLSTDFYADNVADIVIINKNTGGLITGTKVTTYLPYYVPDGVTNTNGVLFIDVFDSLPCLAELWMSPASGSGWTAPVTDFLVPYPGYPERMDFYPGDDTAVLNGFGPIPVLSSPTHEGNDPPPGWPRPYRGNTGELFSLICSTFRHFYWYSQGPGYLSSSSLVHTLQDGITNEVILTVGQPDSQITPPGGTIADTDLYVKADWFNFDRAGLLWMNIDYTEESVEKTLEYIKWGSTVITKEKLFSLFHIPEGTDITDVLSINYLPGLGNNEEVKNILAV